MSSWPPFSRYSDDSASYRSNPANAMRLTPVRRAVTAISQDLARIPIKAYRGDDQVEIGDPISEILNVDFNEYHTAYEARRWMIMQTLLWGNGFAVISRRASEVDSLIPLNSWSVSLNQHDNGRLEYNTSEYGEVAPEDIIHLRMPSTIRQMWGASPVADAVRAMQLAGMLETAGVEAYRMPGLGKLSVQLDEVVGSDAIRSLADSFVAGHSGPEGILRPIITQGGAKVEQVGRSLVDQDWSTARRQAIEDIARAFGVPPFVLFEEIQTYTQEHARLYADSLLGYTHGFASELRRKLYPLDRGIRLSFDMTQLLRGSFGEAMNAYQVAISTGVMTSNEVRKELNLPPLEGGDDLRVGPNMMSVPGGTDEDTAQDGGAGFAEDS